ncbi:MAG: fibronectin type III domain-containing protein [Nanobdellota archaeon]
MYKKIAAILFVFLMINLPIAAALQINENSIQVTELNSDSAKISWTTDVESYGYIDYGISSNDMDTIPETGGTTSYHSVVLEDLFPGEKYYYKVRAKDGYTDVDESAFFEFTTLLQTPENLELDSVSHNSAKIKWDDVQSSQRYRVFVNGELYQDTNKCSLEINDLSAETDYTAYVRALDSEERMSPPSNEIEFTTENIPFNISFAEVTGITNTSAAFSWETSREAVGKVEYGTDVNLGKSMQEDTQKKEHSITLENLAPDTVYYYSLVSGDESTDVESFKTRESRDDLEVISFSSISVDSVKKDSAIISWETNIPSKGEINYGTDENLGSTKVVPEESTTHSVKLSNLLSTTEYFFKISAKGVSSSFNNFNTKASTKNFLSVNDLPELTSSSKVNVSGTTAVNGRVYIFTNDDSSAQVREVIEGTKFRFPVKLSSMEDYKGKRGTNKITVMSWDANGNKDTVEKFIRYDSSEPSLKIRNVPSLTNSDAIKVKGISEKGAHIEFFLDDQLQIAIDKLEQESFEKDINIGTKGETVLKVTSEDKAGNKATYKKKLKIDTTAPEVKFNNTWKPTHFKLYRVWGSTEPGATVKAVNLGKYKDCDTVAHELDYVSCSDFLEQKKQTAQVDPVSYALGVSRKTTADDDGEFSLIIPLLMHSEDGDGTESDNNIMINVTDKAGNTNEYSKSLIYKPGCSDWSTGKIQSYPFNVYTSDMRAGDIAGSAFFPIYYNGAGQPEVLEISIGEDKADESGKVVNPDSSFLESGSNDMVNLEMHNDNKYVTMGNPKASAYNPTDNAFNVYAPITINQYSGSIEKLPDVLYAYMSVNIVYEGQNGKTSCEVYPTVSFDVQKPENVAEWMSPEQINDTIEGIEQAINYTEQAVDIAKKASNYGLLACGAMIAWQYVKGFAGSDTSSGSDGCSQQEQDMQKVYYMCDRVLCPSAPPDCNEFKALGNYNVGGESATKGEYQKQLNKNIECRENFKEARAGDSDNVKSFDTWKNENGNCGDYQQITAPTFKNEIEDPNNPDKKMRLSVNYFEVKNGNVVGEYEGSDVNADNDNVNIHLQIGTNELRDMARQECGRTGSGTLIVTQTASEVGEAGVFFGSKQNEYSGLKASCELGKSPEEILAGGENYGEDEIPDNYGVPNEKEISACYDESCPQFDGTKCPKWFSLLGDSSGSSGNSGYADINPPEGLWSSLKCVCLPAILKHLQNYLKIMKGAKKCLEQARIGEVKGGFCERLMAQFACDLIIEALKYILSMDYSSSSGGARGMISDYKENSAQVSESLSNRYSGVVDERLGLSQDQLVHKACMFAITQDWKMLDGIFENYIDTVDVEPVVNLQGESRPYGYDPFTGKMSVGYNIYVGLVPGGDTNIRLLLKCNPEEPGGEYCGTESDPVDITSKLGRSHLTADDRAINRNLRYQETVKYWYNMVELQLDYNVGDEHKTRTITKRIWRKGDLAANCYFDPTKGIYCDAYTGFANEDGILNLIGFDAESRISPRPNGGSFVPGNNVAALVKVNNQFTGKGYIRFKNDESEMFEYELQGSGEKTGEDREGGSYYNLWVDHIKDSRASTVYTDVNKDILAGTDPITLADDNHNNELKLQFTGINSAKLACGDDDDKNTESFSGKNDKPIEGEQTIECPDNEVDSLVIKDLQFSESDVATPTIEVKIDNNWESFEINTGEDENDDSLRSGTEDLTMNAAEDTTGNGKGDSPVLYDGRSQESTTSYSVMNKKSGNPPAVDWIEPHGELLPYAKGKKTYVGFNIWNDNTKLEEVNINIKGAGMNNDDFDCDIKYTANNGNNEEEFEENNCKDVFENIEEGRLNFMGQSNSNTPPFFELKLAWQSGVAEKYVNQDAKYRFTVKVKDENGVSTPRKQMFDIVSVANTDGMKISDFKVILGGEDLALSPKSVTQSLGAVENPPPATS